MSANTSLITVAANAAAAAITHWGLVDATGNELPAGTYTRIASAGTNNSNTVRPAADCVFNIPASTTVGGWRAYNAPTAGTNQGGGNITPNEVYGSAGTFTLTASATGFPFAAV